jgi:hypothetical protein
MGLIASDSNKSAYPLSAVVRCWVANMATCGVWKWTRCVLLSLSRLWFQLENFLFSTASRPALESAQSCNGYGGFPREFSGKGVKLNFRLHLVPRSLPIRLHGAVLNYFSTGKTLPYLTLQKTQ